MKFNITESKLERWVKQEEGCYVAAGAVSSVKLPKPSVHQGLASKRGQTIAPSVCVKPDVKTSK